MLNSKKNYLLLALILTGVTGCAGFAAMDPDQVTAIFGAIIGHQVTQFTFAFSLAAFIHSGRVKKEIASQFSGLVTSIDNVTATLKQDLAAQNSRLAGVESGIIKLTGRVEVLEKSNADKAQTKG